MARELVAQLQRLRAFTGHAPSIGSHHERILAEAIRPMLSQRHSLRSGFVFSAGGLVSRQGDILLIDENHPAPYLFRSGDLVVVQPEAVRCVIEVKTRLTKRSFRDAVDNLHSFWVVSKEHNHYPARFLFAFDSPQLTPKLLDSWYKCVQIPDEVLNYPIKILVLNRGMLTLMAAKKDRPLGHYLTVEPGTVKVQSLSVFFQDTRKYLEIGAGVKNNPYVFAEFGDLEVLHAYLRFGTGYREDPDIRIIDRD